MSKNELVSPAFLLEEIEDNTAEIAEKAGIVEKEVKDILHKLLAAGSIKIVPVIDYEGKMYQAGKLSPDIEDVPYFALALKFNCDMWSNDKKLKEQNIVKVYTTEELSLIR